MRLITAGTLERLNHQLPFDRLEVDEVARAVLRARRASISA